MATAAFTLLYHYPILYFDHWDFVPLYQRSMNGTLTWSALFAPHGTHWHAGGYMLMLVSARLFGMTQGAEVSISLVLALIACAALYFMLRDGRHGARVSPALFAILALFLFSLDQAENWLWGWQISLFLNVAGAALALWLLSSARQSIGAIICAMIAAAVAIYSFATGLALLPVGAVVIWLKSRRLNMALILWAVFSLTIAVHYKIAVLDTQPAYVASITPQSFSVGTLTSIVSFALIQLGSAVGRFSDYLPQISTLLGIGVGLTAFFRMTPEQRSDSAGAAGLFLYGLGAAGLIASGRLGFDNASISRYITFANFFWMGVVALGFAAAALEHNRRFKDAARILLIVLLIGKVTTIANVLGGANAGFAHAEEIRRVGAVICRAYPDVPAPVLDEIAMPAQKIEAPLAYLAHERLSLFRACMDGKP